MQLIMPALKCPGCGASLEKGSGTGRPWICPRCSRKFQFSRTYSGAIAWIALSLCLLSFYVLGLRPWQLLAAALVLWFPVLLVLTYILGNIFPPPLEPYYATREQAHFVSLFSDDNPT